MKRRWLVAVAFIFIALLLIIPFALTLDLFQTPTEVAASRKGFHQLKSRYYSDPAKWDEELEQLANLEEAPLEALLAALAGDFELNSPHFQDIAIFPTGNKSIIISKKEESRLPVKVIVSLEVEVLRDENGVHTRFLALRRGSRELQSDLAWVYFGEELQLLDGLITKLYPTKQ